MDQNNNAATGMESEIDASAFAQTETVILHEQQTADEQNKWCKELDAARRERKDSDKVAVKALKRYRDESSNENKANGYNIYFANTDLKLAALYANIPQPDVSRRFADPDDQIGRVASNILQRALTYELETGNFDAEFRGILFDSVVPGFGVGWIRYEECQEPQPDLPQLPIQHPLTGALIAQASIPQPPVTTHQEACIDYVAWDDFFWAPSKTWTLCPWVARRVPMTKAAIEKRFTGTCDPATLKDLEYSNKGTTGSDAAESLHPKNQVEETVDVYEFWDKERKLIFWVCEAADMPLDVQDDTCGFDGFFPTPMTPLGRFDTSNTQPISDFKETRGKYGELDSLNARCVELEKGLKLRFCYDGSSPELKNILKNVAENEGIAVANWGNFMTDKGGIAGSMQFVDLTPIANAYQIATGQLNNVKAQIYEVEGISDIQRGLATPYETATATTAKMASSFGRFATKQAEVAKYLAALLKLKAHMICRFYEPQIIMARIGTLPQADQQYIQPALQLLKDEEMTGFRLKISVDSLQLPNWNTEKADRTSLLQAVTGFMSQVLPGVQQVPQLGPIAMGLLKFSVAGFKGSSDVEGMIDQGIDQMMQAQAQAQASKQSAPATPTPDQAKQQAAQQANQTQLQIAQMKTQSDQQMLQEKNQFEAWKIQQDSQLKAASLQVAQQQNQVAEGRLQHDIRDDQAQHAHGVAMDIMVGSKPKGAV